jgi:hypothetical protein
VSIAFSSFPHQDRSGVAFKDADIFWNINIATSDGLTWLLEITLMPSALITSSTESGGDALHVGLLNHGSEGLLGDAPWFEETREVRSPCAALGSTRGALSQIRPR